MKKYNKIELELTCDACPEQYDAFYEGELVGYLRLRHGHFRAEYKDDVVYNAYPLGDGIFEPEEREKYLKKAKKAIYKALLKDKS